MVEWNLVICPSRIAQAHKKIGTPITQINILPLFSIERPLTPKELYQPCFICFRGEGTWATQISTNASAASDETTHNASLITHQRWTCHECQPPSASDPCPHQLCTIQFSPTPHKAATIDKLPGGKMALSIHALKCTTTPPQTHFHTHQPWPAPHTSYPHQVQENATPSTPQYHSPSNAPNLLPPMQPKRHKKIPHPPQYPFPPHNSHTPNGRNKHQPKSLK